MNPASAVLRFAFASSTFTSLLVLLRAFISRQQFEAAFWPFVVLSAASSLALLAFFVARGHLRVASEVRARRFVVACLKALISTYVKVAALIFVVFGLAIGIGTRSLREGVFLAGLLAIWLSLWLSPAVATFAAARLLRAPRNDA